MTQTRKPSSADSSVSSKPVDFWQNRFLCWKCVQRGTLLPKLWASVASFCLFVDLCAVFLFWVRPEPPAGEERGGSVRRGAAEIRLRRRLHPEGRHVRRLGLHGPPPPHNNEPDSKYQLSLLRLCLLQFYVWRTVQLPGCEAEAEGCHHHPLTHHPRQVGGK